MKKKYQKPIVELVPFQIRRSVLQATSPDPVGGGSGNPDAPELYLLDQTTL